MTQAGPQAGVTGVTGVIDRPAGACAVDVCVQSLIRDGRDAPSSGHDGFSRWP